MSLLIALLITQKRFWSYTKHFSKSSSTIYYFIENNEKVIDNCAKTELLNPFILRSRNELPIDQSRLPHLNLNVEHTLYDIKIDTSTVSTKLLKLKDNKVSSPNSVSVNVLWWYPNFDFPLYIFV